MESRRLAQGALAAGMLAVLTTLAACDVLRDPTPETVTLRLDGASGTEVRLVTSVRFLAQQQIRLDELGLPYDTLLVQVFAAETTHVRLPFTQEYDIGETQRFLARVFRQDPTVDALHVEAEIDGRKRYDKRPTAQPADSLVQFLYVFNGRLGGADGEIF